jgi:RNA polymerase sigma-70 factor (ECF subfamily)
VTDTASEQLGPTDADLVDRCRAGDQEAWGLLVERYSRYVYSIAGRGFRLSDAEAEDVFQDVFLRVYLRLDSIRDGAAVRPWIAQVTRRLCIDHLAAAKGRLEAEEVDEAVVDERLDEIEEAFGVREALRALDERCQELLDRFFARDEPYRQIAEELDLPMGTVASRISRCLDKLRDLLEDDGRNSPAAPSSETSR